MLDHHHEQIQELISKSEVTEVEECLLKSETMNYLESYLCKHGNENYKETEIIYGKEQIVIPESINLPKKNRVSQRGVSRARR